MPQDPPRGSQLRCSYLITPINKYSSQYEHLSKNFSYAPECYCTQGLKVIILTGDVYALIAGCVIVGACALIATRF